jgi:signal transduction histidine kinase
MIIERPDETRRHVMLHPSPNFNAAGQVIGATNTMIDITDCKKAMLESLMLVDRLELKNKELSQFGYMLSHNLRGPVARILGLASIFDVEPNDNNFIVEKIKEATVELDDVVKDINSVVSVRNSENDKLELVLFEHIFDLVKEILAREIAQSNALITIDFTAARSVRTVSDLYCTACFSICSRTPLNSGYQRSSCAYMFEPTLTVILYVSQSKTMEWVLILRETVPSFLVCTESSMGFPERERDFIL